jgi:hypothetical protein
MFKWILILVAFCPFIFAQEKNTFENRELQTGEVLVYSIQYSFIKLGELRFKVIEKITGSEGVSYRTMVRIKSEEWIPFVDINEIYESTYNKENYSEHFRAAQYQYDRERFTEYDFDYSDSLISVKKGYLNPYKVLVDSTCDLNHRLQDGLSLFYFARMFNTESDSVTASIFENEEVRKVEINRKRNSDDVNIDAVEYPVDCFYVYGHIGFSSIFGLTGDYSGWFTNDKHAVPVRAKLKVRIGNITAELKEWRKGKWKPPKYNN